MVFLTILLVPVLIALGFMVLGKGQVTFKEFLAQVAACCAVAGIATAICYYSNVHDTEVWNGRVANKASEHVSCQHSYSCNCRQSCSGSGSSRSCSEVCDTCYEHSYDVDWPVYTTNNERITIDRIDRQGVDTPPRWVQVVIGEPTSVAHSYENYIKGAPDTLFRRGDEYEKYKDMVPAYPQNIYDYYRLNRVVTVGVGLPDQQIWNDRLSVLNGQIGAAKQVNVIILLTSLPRDYKFALEYSWLGGKKNDAIIIIGLDDQRNVVWADTMAWSKTSDFQVHTRDALMGMGTLDINKTFAIIGDNVTGYYDRKPMHDFDYLKASIQPTTTEYMVSIIIATIISLGLGFFFLNEDPFGDDYRSRYSYGNRYNRW